jgi:hypothetical protein
MKKHTHQSSESSHAQPLCSCGNRSCEVMEIVRLLLETTDNFLLLQAGRKTLQETLIPMLDHMHRDQKASLERWQIEQDIYRSQMASSVRPTLPGSSFLRLSRNSPANNAGFPNGMFVSSSICKNVMSNFRRLCVVTRLILRNVPVVLYCKHYAQNVCLQ